MQDLSIDERRTLRQTGIGVVFQASACSRR